MTAKKSAARKKGPQKKAKPKRAPRARTGRDSREAGAGERSTRSSRSASGRKAGKGSAPELKALPGGKASSGGSRGAYVDAPGQGAGAASGQASGRPTERSGSRLDHRLQAPHSGVRQDRCIQCEKDLRNAPRALFVEEELGRVFCSENCIVAYFAPEIDRMERDYFHFVSAYDLSPEVRDGLAHLRWTTLENPDEVWREKTLSGDHRYTLISEYDHEGKSVWSVCVTLFLRNDPSFLFLAFVSRETALVDRYRRGERVEWVRGRSERQQQEEAGEMAGEKEFEAVMEGSNGDQDENESLDPVDARLQEMMEQPVIDGLAEPWTEDETYRAKMVQYRRDDDIPSADFHEYEVCLEDTLQTPDEVWTMTPGKKGPMLFHFLRHFSDRSMWYVIVARETDEEDQLEILDAFPTRDPDLIDRYRRGAQEIGPQSDAPSTSRMIH